MSSKVIFIYNVFIDLLAVLPIKLNCFEVNVFGASVWSNEKTHELHRVKFEIEQGWSNKIEYAVQTARLILTFLTDPIAYCNRTPLSINQSHILIHDAVSQIWACNLNIINIIRKDLISNLKCSKDQDSFLTFCCVVECLFDSVVIYPEKTIDRVATHFFVCTYLCIYL